ncbi:hypothetical protein A3K73_06365 [Candidatus Pacearchaeota archaeon RBG_13_36_9]|nr:MAG: hypothetical protein A3K73_06365 [Candidatus Pacearchaeota archaeon RBG_13_36_9]
MRKQRGLDYQLEQERTGVRIIPEDLFKGRDLIPCYGFFSSGYRAAKEVASFFISSDKNMGTAVRRRLRMFPRLFEWLGVTYYNAGILIMAETLYTMAKN